MKQLIVTIFALVLWAVPAYAQQEVDASALFLGTTGAVCKGTSGSAPSSPATCDWYVNTTDGKLYMRWSTGAWVAAGSVSSVTITVPTGITASGCTITTSGTCALSFTSGYMLPGGGGTTGTFLRRNTTPEWSTLVLPNSITSGRVVFGSATNTYGDDADLTFATDTLSATNATIATTFIVSSTADIGTFNLASFVSKSPHATRYSTSFFVDQDTATVNWLNYDSTGSAYIAEVRRGLSFDFKATVTANAFEVVGNVLPQTAYVSNLGSITKKFLTLHAAELLVETLVAQDVMATIGGRIVVAPTTLLTAALSATGLSIVVKHNNLALGDILRMEAGGQVEFMKVNAACTGTSGLYICNVDRNLDGTGANAWSEGDAVLNTGTTGDGVIDLFSMTGMLSGTGPTIMGSVRTGTTYSDLAPRWAIGELNGLYGYNTSTYGFAAGDTAAAWVKVDATNGVRIGHGATTKVQIDASGNATFAGSLSAATGTFAGSLSAATGSFSGTVTATAGAFGGFEIGTDYARDVANSFGMASTVSGSDDVRFWAGSTFANRAATTTPLRIFESGKVYAQSLYLSGAVTIEETTFGSGITLTLQASSLNPAGVSATYFQSSGGVYGTYIVASEGFLALTGKSYKGVGAGASAFNLMNGQVISTLGHVVIAPDGDRTAIGGRVRVGGLTTPTVALDVTGAALVSSTLGVTGNTTIGAAIVATGAITSTSLSANTDNWNPTGLATTRYIRAASDAAYNLTGIVAQTSGTEIILWNGGAFTITLKHETTSTASNRFLGPGAADFALTQYKAVTIRYDGTSSRWIIVG